jgi:hypothetical protein
VDEWGLYDPEQAGLSALFVRLADTRLARRDARSKAAGASAAADEPVKSAEDPAR